MPLQLVPITIDGACQTSLVLHALAQDVLRQTAENYARTGFAPPWIGYLTFDDGVNIGTCAFTAAPSGSRVEIAYFTFPEHEGKGYATVAAAELVAIARRTQPDVVVTAHTLPEENASTCVLTRLGFSNKGSLQHPEDGEVWLWVLG